MVVVILRGGCPRVAGRACAERAVGAGPGGLVVASSGFTVVVRFATGEAQACVLRVGAASAVTGAAVGAVGAGSAGHGQDEDHLRHHGFFLCLCSVDGRCRGKGGTGRKSGIGSVEMNREEKQRQGWRGNGGASSAAKASPVAPAHTWCGCEQRWTVMPQLARLWAGVAAARRGLWMCVCGEATRSNASIYGEGAGVAFAGWPFLGEPPARSPPHLLATPASPVQLAPPRAVPPARACAAPPSPSASAAGLFEEKSLLCYERSLF